MHAVVILDDDGNRIYSKYFHADSTKAEQVTGCFVALLGLIWCITGWLPCAQRDFEQKLNKKTKGLSARTECACGVLCVCLYCDLWR